MLKLPSKLLRKFRGGPLDGTKYAMVTTLENYEQGYIVVELEGADDAPIYVLADKEPFEDAEIQYFDYKLTLPLAEAREWVQADSPHRRN